MQVNIDKIMQRGQNLDYLEDRSEMLSSNANEFRVGARRISRKMWWNNMKINIIIGIVILAIILIIICKYYLLFINVVGPKRNVNRFNQV